MKFKQNSEKLTLTSTTLKTSIALELQIMNKKNALTKRNVLKKQKSQETFDDVKT